MMKRNERNGREVCRIQIFLCLILGGVEVKRQERES